MNPNRLLWIGLLAGLLAMGLAIYRSRYPRTGIDPHAADQIRSAEKR